ncbi:ribonuclease H-like domain-containing protein [Tanacetum coccineum]
MYDEYNPLVKMALGYLSQGLLELICSSQQLGVDFDELFNPVVKPATIRIVFSLAMSRRSSYGLKQAHRAWFQRFAGYATRLDFITVAAILLCLSIDRVLRKYVFHLLERAHKVNCNPSRTHVDTESKLGPEGVPVCLYMHDPREPHFAALKRILRYVRGTMDFDLQLYVSATTSLVGFIDADWAGCPSTHKSTSGYCVFLGDNLLSWSSKHQHTFSRSSAEVEFRGVTNVVAKTAWLHNLLCELHSRLSTATLVYCDNVSAVYLSANPVQYQRTKHIEIDIHFVRDMVTAGQAGMRIRMSPFIVGFNGIPFRTIVLLLMSPCSGVKWYSSRTKFSSVDLVPTHETVVLRPWTSDVFFLKLRVELYADFLCSRCCEH